MENVCQKNQSDVEKMFVKKINPMLKRGLLTKINPMLKRGLLTKINWMLKRGLLTKINWMLEGCLSKILDILKDFFYEIKCRLIIII